MNDLPVAAQDPGDKPSGAAEIVRRPKERDVRLDFFRGASLAIIFIAHVQGNSWNSWIPARFGFSDAADTFVFCSGFASGLAFYKVFNSHGAMLGALRVGFRVWQVYWAHVLMTLAAAVFALATLAALPETRLLDQFGLRGFVENFERSMGLLLTLQAQPGRSDILPMYLVMLAAMPAAVLLSRVNRYLPALACLTLYAVVQAYSGPEVKGEFNLRHAGGYWFFNPFAWQIYFFAGFLIASGILPAPPRHWALTAFALAVVILSLPVSDVGVRYLGEGAREIRWELIGRGLEHKINLAPMRVLHFFCTVYLVSVAWTGLKTHLRAAWAGPIVLMGQYALAIFMVGVLLSMAGTAVAGVWRGGELMWLVVNLAGIAGLYVTALVARETRRLDRNSAPLPA